MTDVVLWFDPVCPWCWITSRWLIEAEAVRDIRARFRVMSLAVLNGIGLDDLDVWGPVRVAIAIELSQGPDAVRRFYTEFGTLHHNGKMPTGRDLYARALDRAGLPHTLANAAGSTFYDDAVAESHRLAVEPVGGDLGTPIIHLPGPDGTVALFGPVMTPRPRGEDAGRLWDAVATAAATEGFYELKRTRHRPPSFA
jgi:hypothetical protein